MKKRSLLCLSLSLLSLAAAAQDTGKSRDPKDAESNVKAAEASAKAAFEILQKTLTAYQSAKSYQGDWTYLLQQDGGQVQKMAVTLRAKGPAKLLFHLRPEAGKPDKDGKTPSGTPVPELTVLLDGKYAWSENATEKVYYKVLLPKNPVSSPLMFFPQMNTVGAVERGPDGKVKDHTVAVLFAKTASDGLSRMEIDTSNYHILRIASDEVSGFSRTISTLVIDKEVFDGDIPDSTFSYKPGKGFKEIAAPPDAGALFGAGSSEKSDKPEKPDR